MNKEEFQIQLEGNDFLLGEPIGTALISMAKAFTDVPNLLWIAVSFNDEICYVQINRTNVPEELETVQFNNKGTCIDEAFTFLQASFNLQVI